MLSGAPNAQMINALEVMSPDVANANKVIMRHDDSFYELPVDIADPNGNRSRKLSTSSATHSLTSIRSTLSMSMWRILPNLGSSCFAPMIHKVMGTEPHPGALSDSGESYVDEYSALKIPYKDLEFALTDWIGSGTEGVVFLGRYRTRNVAIKRMNSEINLAGIKRLKELNDPNIVQYIGVAQDPSTAQGLLQEQYYIVMEYCSNGQLFNVLGKRDITKNLFLKWTMQIASGMEKFHTTFKLIHRDLKTLNILVDENDDVKICDCEGHKESEKKSQMMSMRGTTGWMAPEYIRGENCTEKVDVWSFGVVFWEIMTQQKPYYGIESQAVMFKVGRGELQLHIPSSSPHAATLIMKQCWSQTPMHRPSFKYIISQLQNLQEELRAVSDDMWRMRKEAWKKEIERQRVGSFDQDEGKQMQAYKAEEVDELIKQRIRELQHSQELRKTYEDRLKRVDLLYNRLMREKVAIENEKEQQRANRYRIERNMQVNVGTSRGSAVSSEIAGRNARIFLPRDSYESSDDEELHTPSISRESPYRNSNIPKSGSSRFSRESSVRSFVSDRCRRSSSSIKVSPSTIVDRAIPYNTHLHRGSPVRASAISTDSGVPSERDFGSSYALEVERSSVSVQTDAPIYRNSEGRYSDTKIAVQQRRKPRKASVCGTPTFMRNSPSRPIRRQDSTKRLTCPNPQITSIGVSMEDVQIEIDHSLPTTSSHGHRRSSSMFETPNRNGNLWSTETTPQKTVESAPMPMEHHFRNYPQNINMTLSVVSSHDNEGNDVENHCSDASAESSSEDEKNPESVSARGDNGNLFESSLDSSVAGSAFDKRHSLQSDQSGESDRCSRSITSSVISWGALERSLEKGIAHSDGLSDRELTIRNSFRSRCRRNPHEGGLPRVEDELSVSSDNDERVGESYC